MPSPTQIAAVNAAGNRADRVRRMAETMAHYKASDGGCTDAHLAADGFAEAEIAAYHDDAVRHLAGLPPAGAQVPSGRLDGLALVARAQAIRARRGRWTPPVVTAGEPRAELRSGGRDV